MAKATKKFTDSSDDKYDVQNKIAEGSKQDMSLDKKRGVPENDGPTNVKKKKKVAAKPKEPIDVRGMINQFFPGGKK